MHSITENLFCFCSAEALATNPVNKNCLVFASSTAKLGFTLLRALQSCDGAVCARGRRSATPHGTRSCCHTQATHTLFASSQVKLCFTANINAGLWVFLLHLAQITAGTLQPKPSHYKDVAPLREVVMPQGQELAFNPREKHALARSFRQKTHGLCSKYLLKASFKAFVIIWINQCF